jgi:predicted PurR-regulated permease PerM
MHPVATLLSMFVGLYLFGPLGIWGLPVTLALLTRMHHAGNIKLFKT